MSDAAALKRAAAAEAVERVESGMRLGLGTGSTVEHFLELLGERLADGALADLMGVPTSVATTDRAHALGIALGPLHELAPLDLAVDGADEIDAGLNLVKGLGGALLREKMVAAASRRFIVIADEGKLVERLGEKSPLPVEVASFSWQVHVPYLESLGARPVLRTRDDGTPVPTDNGNYVLDCWWDGGLPPAAELQGELCSRPGIVETGLFIGMAGEAIVAGAGGVRLLTPGGAEGGA
ncbi:MAG: ribose 5-phosphate isomerase A [Gemmatimonadetes bacterium]|nr:ribose 5-phosphate isomerase A [Gemmatimonadota bacterium]